MRPSVSVVSMSSSTTPSCARTARPTTCCAASGDVACRTSPADVSGQAALVSASAPAATRVGTADPYPSRRGRAPELLRRLDPVVWGDAREGPLRPAQVAQFAERGFVTYRHLDGATGAELDGLIGAAINCFAADEGLVCFEWKTRGHDAPADLGER